MSKKKERINRRLVKLCEEFIRLNNRILINEYEQRLAKHSLLTIKDRDDVHFETQEVEVKKRGKLPYWEVRKYRCWTDHFTDSDTGAKHQIGRHHLIYLDGIPVDENGNKILPPELFENK